MLDTSQIIQKEDAYSEGFLPPLTDSSWGAESLSLLHALHFRLRVPGRWIQRRCRLPAK